MNSNINNIRNLNESAIRYKVLTFILRIVQIELVLLCLGGWRCAIRCQRQKLLNHQMETKSEQKT